MGKEWLIYFINFSNLLHGLSHERHGIAADIVEKYILVEINSKVGDSPIPGNERTSFFLFYYTISVKYS